jgi:hypothetical protein
MLMAFESGGYQFGSLSALKASYYRQRIAVFTKVLGIRQDRFGPGFFHGSECRQHCCLRAAERQLGLG